MFDLFRGKVGLLGQVGRVLRRLLVLPVHEEGRPSWPGRTCSEKACCFKLKPDVAVRRIQRLGSVKKDTSWLFKHFSFFLCLSVCLSLSLSLSPIYICLLLSCCYSVVVFMPFCSYCCSFVGLLLLPVLRFAVAFVPLLKKVWPTWSRVHEILRTQRFPVTFKLPAICSVRRSSGAV